MGTPRSFLSLAAIGFRRSKPTTSAASASRFLDSHRFATSSPQPPPSDSPSVIKPFAQTGPPDDEPKKGLLAKLYDRYSLASSQNRIVLGERFFHAARRRASDPKWHTHAHVPNNFRSRQALLTLHVWFLHRRLIADSSQDKDQWLIVQEEMFDSLWNDARCRIRAEGVNELTVNKHLKDVQSITFRLCTHLDHAFEEHQDDAEKRYEEIAGAIWVNMWNREEDAPHDAMRRLAIYVDYQFRNILTSLPDEYFREGRVAWGLLPSFEGLKDNNGNSLSPLVPGGEHDSENKLPSALPGRWVEALTEAGDKYYWDEETMESQWERPVAL